MSGGKAVEMIPNQVILGIYRRYLKSALLCTNPTIRGVLLSQIKGGFAKNRFLRSPVAQRELVAQAHRDLQILEDERHTRTLYLNKFGQVSCMEWELRRTEWHFFPNGYKFMTVISFSGAYFCLFILMNTQREDTANPEIAKTVDYMAIKLEVDDPKMFRAKRQNDLLRHLEDLDRSSDLEKRILMTFKNSPASLDQLPSSLHPEGQKQYDFISSNAPESSYLLRANAAQ